MGTKMLAEVQPGGLGREPYGWSTGSMRRHNRNQRSAAYMWDGETIGPFVELATSQSARHCQHPLNTYWPAQTASRGENE